MINDKIFSGHLKFLVFVLSLLIFNNSFSQDISDSDQIIKRNGRYVYNNSIYKKSELREVIYDSHDPEAIRLIDKAKTSKIVKLVSGITGVTFLAVGSIISAYEFRDVDFIFGDEPVVGLPLIIAGFGVLLLITMPSAITSSVSYNKAIERFNSIQIGSQNIRFYIIPTPEFSGFGLTWKLNY